MRCMQHIAWQISIVELHNYNCSAHLYVLGLVLSFCRLYFQQTVTVYKSFKNFESESMQNYLEQLICGIDTKLTGLRMKWMNLRQSSRR